MDSEETKVEEVVVEAPVETTEAPVEETTEEAAPVTEEEVAA